MFPLFPKNIFASRVSYKNYVNNIETDIFFFHYYDL